MAGPLGDDQGGGVAALGHGTAGLVEVKHAGPDTLLAICRLAGGQLGRSGDHLGLVGNGRGDQGGLVVE